MSKLTGLQEKIFIDRYTLKDNRGENAKVGDTVIVLISQGNSDLEQKKEVGTVTNVKSLPDGTLEIDVELRNGNVVSVHKDKISIALETEPEHMWSRVAKAVSKAEKTSEKQKEWDKNFHSQLDDWKLVPGGRIAAGAGASDELTLYNCYVIPSPKDSRGGIMETNKSMSEIMARGGGVGISISTLRPKRALVKGVNGSSSGSVSWGGLFSYTTGLIEQGGSRRGALMLMINDWHPDVPDFITAKQVSGKITNANMSVAISNEFMNAVKNDLDWNLKFPDTSFKKYNDEWDGNIKKWESKGYPIIVHKTLKARELWNTIVESAWKSAEPGVVFMEHYNNVSNSHYFNPIICTNPCAEQGLPGWGVCTLSSVNLSKFVEDGEVDWEGLRTAIHTGIRFLDNVIDVTPYHFKENKENQQKERRIGLGVLALAEMLIKLGIKYGSDESIEFMDKLFDFFQLESYKASIDLAEEKGAFPAFDFEKFIYNSEARCKTEAGKVYDRLDDTYKNKLRTTGMRNVTVNTMAPTGSTGTMVNTSTGIEPFFAFEFYRQSRLGLDKQYVPLAQEWLEKNNATKLPDYFVSAMELSAEDHVKVQAVVQKYVDSSISKTANAPSTFTVEDTKKLYELAYDLGCKGITCYVDGSRDQQVLMTEKKEEEREEVQQLQQQNNKVVTDNGFVIQKRPSRLQGFTDKVSFMSGDKLSKAYVTINIQDGQPWEVFISTKDKEISAIAKALGLMTTKLLRLGGTSDNLQQAIDTLRYDQTMGTLPSMLANILTNIQKEQATQDIEKEIRIPVLKKCPSCGKNTYDKGACICRNEKCGYSSCG